MEWDSVPPETQDAAGTASRADVVAGTVKKPAVRQVQSRYQQALGPDRRQSLVPSAAHQPVLGPVKAATFGTPSWNSMGVKSMAPAADRRQSMMGAPPSRRPAMADRRASIVPHAAQQPVSDAAAPRDLARRATMAAPHGLPFSGLQTPAPAHGLSTSFNSAASSRPSQISSRDTSPSTLDGSDNYASLAMSGMQASARGRLGAEQAGGTGFLRGYSMPEPMTGVAPGAGGYDPRRAQLDAYKASKFKAQPAQQAPAAKAPLSARPLRASSSSGAVPKLDMDRIGSAVQPAASQRARSQPGVASAAALLPDERITKAAAQVRLPDGTPRLKETPRASPVSARQSRLSDVQMQHQQQSVLATTPKAAAAAVIGAKSGTPRSSRIPTPRTTPQQQRPSPAQTRFNTQQDQQQPAQQRRTPRSITPLSARNQQQQQRGATPRQTARQQAPVQLQVQQVLRAAHAAGEAAEAMMVAAAASRPRRMEPEEARRHAQGQQLLEAMLTHALAKLLRALEELRGNFKAQLTAAAGLVNAMEQRVARMRLELAKLQRRRQMQELLDAMLPLLRRIKAIKKEHGAVVQALCATLQHDAARVPLVNGASLGVPHASQLAALLRQGQELMRKMAEPLGKLLGPHAQKRQADKPDAGEDTAAAADQGAGSGTAPPAAATAEAGGDGNVHSDPSIVTTRVMLEQLVAVVGQNCTTLDECAYQMGALSDLETQAASMQALLMQLRQLQASQQ